MKDEAQRQKYEAVVAAEMEKRQRVVNEAGATPAGRELFRMLKGLCGFYAADRVMDKDGKVDLVATALNSERRTIYLNLRGLMSPEVRLAVEHGNEEANNA